MTRVPAVLLLGLLAFASIPAVNHASAQSAGCTRPDCATKCKDRGWLRQSCEQSCNLAFNNCLSAAKSLAKETANLREAGQKRREEADRRFEAKLHRDAEEHRKQMTQQSLSYPGMPSRTLQKLSR